MAVKITKKKGKFLVAGILIFGVVAYLTYAGIRDTQLYYMTPTEIIENDKDMSEKGLRLGGIVVDGSIDFDSSNLRLSFEVGDGNRAIPVTYKGVVPDAFENGVEIVVEGVYSPEGVFLAEVLLPKCPSKYEPAN